MAEFLAIALLVSIGVHIVGAIGYTAGGRQPQNSVFFQTLGVVETVIAVALAIVVL